MAKFLLGVKQRELKNQFKCSKSSHKDIPKLTLGKVYDYPHNRKVVHEKIRKNDIVYLKELGAGGVVFSETKVISSETATPHSGYDYLLKLEVIKNTMITTKKFWDDFMIAAGADYKIDF